LGSWLSFSPSSAAPAEVDPIYTNESGPPPEGGSVDRSDAKFYFLSDVEDSTLEPNEHPSEAVQADTSSAPLPRLVPWIRNVNDRDLTFIWEDQQIYRIAREHPLPQNAIESYPHSVCGYYLASNSNILYTQQQRRIITSAYQAREDPQRPSCKIAKEDDLWSILSELWSAIITSYRDENGDVIDVRLDIRNHFDGKDLVYEMQGDINNVRVGLTGLQAAFDAAFSMDPIESQLEDGRLKLQVSKLEDHLLKDDLPRLPPNLLEEEFWIFYDMNAPAGEFEFRIPIENFSTLTQSAESVALFDGEGSLVSVGPAALYVPR
jgi:hypothetical protein